MSEHEIPGLGPCCNCGSTENVVNIVMLERKAPTPGFGWGCFVCGLPPDGAIAVLCDDCVGQAPLSVCDGYPKDGKRMAIAQLPPGEFTHDADVVHE